MPLYNVTAGPAGAAGAAGTNGTNGTGTPGQFAWQPGGAGEDHIMIRAGIITTANSPSGWTVPTTAAPITIKGISYNYTFGVTGDTVTIQLYVNGVLQAGKTVVIAIGGSTLARNPGGSGQGNFGAAVAVAAGAFVELHTIAGGAYSGNAIICADLVI